MPVQQEAMPVQQQQAPPPVLIHALAHQQPVVLTLMSPDYLFDFDAVCSPAAPLPPYTMSTIAADFMLFPDCVAAPLSIGDTVHSYVIFTAPSTCSTKCLHLAITTDLVYSKMEARPRYPLCMLFNTSCSGDGGRDWRTDLFYEDPRWLILAQGDTTTPKMGMRSFLSD
jgi:hypothetical protein